MLLQKLKVISLQETEPESKMDLDAFLSQFVLIKTPYGYILARAPQQQQDPMTR